MAGVTFTYNANGNLTEESSGGETTYYTYDFRNRLTQVVIDAGVRHTVTIDYTYDMYNRLIGRTQTGTLPVDLGGLDYLASNDVYIYDGANPVLEFTNMSGSMGETQRFLWGPAVDQLLGVELIEDGSTYELWPVTDNQHSVQELLYQNDEEDYLAYNAQGQPLGEGYPGLEMYWAGAVGFTGAFMDPVTGLQYMSTGNGGGRWYEPLLSRWMTPDPSGVGTNLYEYCFNSPTDFTDSDGLSPISGAPLSAAPLPGSAPRSAASFSPAEIADIMGANTSDPIPCGPCATRVPPSMTPGSSFPSSHVITFTTAAGGYVRLIVSDGDDSSGSYENDFQGRQQDLQAALSAAQGEEGLNKMIANENAEAARYHAAHFPPWDFPLTNAYMSLGSYPADDLQPTTLHQLSERGWTNATAYTDAASGFRAVLFNNPTSGQAVLAFTGTQGGLLSSAGRKDWAANFGQGLTFESKQFDFAIALAHKLKKRYGDKLTLTGHSKGGAQAAAAALVNNICATTFNGSGVTNATLARWHANKDNANSLVTAYRVRYEPLSSYQTVPFTPGPANIGQTIWISGDSLDPLSRHGMEDVLYGMQNR